MVVGTLLAVGFVRVGMSDELISSFATALRPIIVGGADTARNTFAVPFGADKVGVTTCASSTPFVAVLSRGTVCAQAAFFAVLSSGADCARVLSHRTTLARLSSWTRSATVIMTVDKSVSGLALAFTTCNISDIVQKRIATAYTVVGVTSFA
jgi:hypothetical protein